MALNNLYTVLSATYGLLDSINVTGYNNAKNLSMAMENIKTVSDICKKVDEEKETENANRDEQE